MKIISIFDYYIGIEDFGELIGIFYIRVEEEDYRCIRVKKDRIRELIDAMSRVTSDQDSEVKVFGAVTDFTDINGSIDVVVEELESGYITIRRDDMSGGWIWIRRNYVTDLAQVLEGTAPASSCDVESHVITGIKEGKPMWINVLNMRDYACIITIDINDNVKGTSIPIDKIPKVADDQQRRLAAHESAIKRGIDVSTDFGLVISDGYGLMGFPADSISSLVKVLREIYDSQKT